MFLTSERLVPWRIGMVPIAKTHHKWLKYQRRGTLLLSLPVFGKGAESEKVWIRGEPLRVFCNSFRMRF